LDRPLSENKIQPELTRLFKAPFSAFYCGVPAAAFIQTFFLGYPIKTTFLALRRSNRAKPLWKICVSIEKCYRF